MLSDHNRPRWAALAVATLSAGFAWADDPPEAAEKAQPPPTVTVTGPGTPELTEDVTTLSTGVIALRLPSRQTGGATTIEQGSGVPSAEVTTDGNQNAPVALVRLLTLDGGTFLGVATTDVGPAMRAQLAGAFPEDFPEDGGVVLERVFDDSPAAESLKQYDVLLSVGGETVVGADGLRQLITARKPGDRVEAKVLRAGQPKTVSVELAERPQEDTQLGLGWQRDSAGQLRAIQESLYLTEQQRATIESELERAKADLAERKAALRTRLDQAREGAADAAKHGEMAERQRAAAEKAATWAERHQKMAREHEKLIETVRQQAREKLLSARRRAEQGAGDGKTGQAEKIPPADPKPAAEKQADRETVSQSMTVRSKDGRLTVAVVRTSDGETTSHEFRGAKADVLQEIDKLDDEELKESLRRVLRDVQVGGGDSALRVVPADRAALRRLLTEGNRTEFRWPLGVRSGAGQEAADARSLVVRPKQRLLLRGDANGLSTLGADLTGDLKLLVLDPQDALSVRTLLLGAGDADGKAFRLDDLPEQTRAAVRNALETVRDLEPVKVKETKGQ